MAENESKSRPFNQSDERFKYIGFGVFPGKAGDIFKSDEERRSLVEKVMRKFNRSEGEVRDGCTLMADRVSASERILLTLASLALIASLFMPWFSGYHETFTTRMVAIEGEGSVPASPAGEGAVPDSAAAAAAQTAVPTDSVQPAGEAAAGALRPEEMRAVTEVHRDRRTLTGLGALFALGTYGSLVFSSGWALMLTGILMIVLLLGSLVMGLYNLYLLYGVKKATPEAYTLHLKRSLKLNWIPVFLWLAVLLLSFVGAKYGFSTEGMIKQVGSGYSLAALIGLSSVGIGVSVGAFLILALKGKEI